MEEVERLLPAFKAKLAGLHPPELTKRGKPRQRRAGAGPKEKLRTDEDKLLFILIYGKTYPIQTMLGLQFEISQPQANYENTIAGVKRCRIVKDIFRNTKAGFSDLDMEVACALHNLRVECRHPQPAFLLCQVASGAYYQ